MSAHQTEVRKLIQEALDASRIGQLELALNLLRASLELGYDPEVARICDEFETAVAVAHMSGEHYDLTGELEDLIAVTGSLSSPTSMSDSFLGDIDISVDLDDSGDFAETGDANSPPAPQFSFDDLAEESEADHARITLDSEGTRDLQAALRGEGASVLEDAKVTAEKPAASATDFTDLLGGDDFLLGGEDALESKPTSRSFDARPTSSPRYLAPEPPPPTHRRGGASRPTSAPTDPNDPFADFDLDDDLSGSSRDTPFAQPSVDDDFDFDLGLGVPNVDPASVEPEPGASQDGLQIDFADDLAAPPAAEPADELAMSFDGLLDDEVDASGFRESPPSRRNSPDMMRTSEVPTVDQDALRAESRRTGNTGEMPRFADDHATRPDAGAPGDAHTRQTAEHPLFEVPVRGADGNVPRPDLQAAPAPQMTPLEAAQSLMKQGDIGGALRLLAETLDVSPNNLEVRQLHNKVRAIWTSIQIQRLAPLERTPRLMIPQGQIYGLQLDPQTMFVVSQVDGMSTLADLIDISGMHQLEAAEMLLLLIDDNIIGVD